MARGYVHEVDGIHKVPRLGGSMRAVLWNGGDISLAIAAVINSITLRGILRHAV